LSRLLERLDANLFNAAPDLVIDERDVRPSHDCEVCKLEQSLKSAATYAEAANRKTPEPGLAIRSSAIVAAQDGPNQESYE
jgi:hypothetical protein